MKALKCLTIAAGAVLGLSAASADEGAIPLSLKGHKFAPAEIHVKANVPNTIVLSNADDTAEEFDSTSLKVEKVVASHSSGNVRLRPLAPGRYPFMGEYHADTAQGVVIAE
ncbi:MAG TPA: cupredoxin domain-containing protein [Rhizomicrobium sp.]